MRVEVLPKIVFNALMSYSGINDTNVESHDDCIFISINNTELIESSDSRKSYFNGNKKNLLILSFDDCDEDLYLNGVLRAKCIIETQAKEIVDFLQSQDKNKITKCYVHCSAGISRSGAVGAFVSDYFGCKYSDFKKVNPFVHENHKVLLLLNRELRERI